MAEGADATDLVIVVATASGPASTPTSPLVGLGAAADPEAGERGNRGDVSAPSRAYRTPLLAYAQSNRARHQVRRWTTHIVAAQ